MRALYKTYQLVLTAVLLQFLACQCSATQVEEDDGMPPGTSLGDHACIHDKVIFLVPLLLSPRIKCMVSCRHLVLLFVFIVVGSVAFAIVNLCVFYAHATQLEYGK